MEENLYSFGKPFMIKLVLIISYFIFNIGIETIYRSKIFDLSIEVEINMQKNWSEASLSFFKIITNLGTITGFFPFLLIIFLFYPLNKSYLVLCLIIHSSYWDNILKIVYGDPRPYWVNTDLSASCNGGFGNPSGHAFSSTAVFLGIADVLTDVQWFKNKIYLKILVYIFFVFLIILIVISRLTSSAHSINQVFYGGMLGLGLYFVLLHLFNLNKINGKAFFNIFRSKLLNSLHLASYISMLVTIFLVYIFIDNENTQYRSLIVNKCPSKEEYRVFNADGAFNALSIFALIGAHLGLVYLTNYIFKYYPNKQNEILNWSWNKKRGIFFVYKIIFLVLACIPLSLYYFIPGDSDLRLIFIFKVSIPYLISLYLIFGPCIWFFIHRKYANPNIYRMDNFSTDSEMRKIEENF